MNAIPTIQASNYQNALEVTNLIAVGQIKLPVEIQCGNSTFTITCANQNWVALGVLMAASWPEPPPFS